MFEDCFIPLISYRQGIICYCRAYGAIAVDWHHYWGSASASCPTQDGARLRAFLMPWRDVEVALPCLTVQSFGFVHFGCLDTALQNPNLTP